MKKKVDSIAKYKNNPFRLFIMEYMQRYNLSVKDIKHLTNLHGSTFNRYYSGVCMPNIRHMCTVIRDLNCTDHEIRSLILSMATYVETDPVCDMSRSCKI